MKQGSENVIVSVASSLNDLFATYRKTKKILKFKKSIEFLGPKEVIKLK